MKLKYAVKYVTQMERRPWLSWDALLSTAVHTYCPMAQLCTTISDLLCTMYITHCNTCLVHVFMHLRILHHSHDSCNFSLSYILKALMVNCTVTHSESSGCRGWDQSVWLTAGSSQAQAPSLCSMASSVNAPAIMLLLIPVRCHTCLCLNSNASVWMEEASASE